MNELLKQRKRLTPQQTSMLSRLAVLFLIICIGTLLDKSFISFNNINNNLANASILIILGIGQTVAIITNGPDLSASSVMTICAVVAAILIKNLAVPFVLAILIAVVIGSLLGALNGYMIAYVGIPSFVATYGLQWAVFGFAYVILHGYVLYGFENNFRFIGNGTLFGFLQMPILIMIIFVILGTLLLKKTNFGRMCFSVGSNEESAVMSGINSKIVIIKAFVFSGVLSALAGILFVSRMNAVQSDIGNAYLLPVLATVYMGGTSALGGEGSIFGTVIGALVITVVTNCLNLLSVPSEWRDAIIGVLIILTVLADTMLKKRVGARKKANA
jgi:ribose transport system permease protein